MSLGRHLFSAAACCGLLVSSLLSSNAAEDVSAAKADAPATAASTDVQPTVVERYQNEDVTEIPDFQKHVSPLFGRLGCNGRSCHGSFQGRGDFRLSLFGYDFDADHKALLDEKRPRVNVEKPLESLIIAKPTDEEMHEGGQRYAKGSWEYHLFRRWVEGGAKFDTKQVQKLTALEITPSEILFSQSGEQVQLKAIAVWADGSREDVTPLCRFQSNSDQVAKITELGLVTATDPGDTHVVVFYDSAVIPVPVIRPVSPKYGDNYPQVATNTKVDELVIQKLRKLGVVPSDLASDADFLRRVSLDLTGTLPTAGEVEAFLADSSADKREKKINELLETPAYAAWWTTKLCDLTGNNDTKLNNVGVPGMNPAQEWYDWLYKRVAENESYDKIVEGIVLAKSRKEGQTYTEYCEEMSKYYHPDSGLKIAERDEMPYYWSRNNIRQPEEKAIGFAYTFLGIRIQCAQCHKHPFDQWSKNDFDAFKSFFTRVTYAQQGARDAREETAAIMKSLGFPEGRVNNNDARKIYSEALKEKKTIPFSEVSITPPQRRKPRPGEEAVMVSARVLGGEDLDLDKLTDTREPLMHWLRSKENPYFAKAFVNRVWANYFNVGIVQPPDDLSLANPPSNKPLLDYLAQGFIEHNFDMKWLHREILSSRTYQLSWQTNETNAKDERNFARAVPRRLPAEVAYDALITATASDTKAASMLTELKGRATAIPGASARSNNNPAGFALQVFGRSIRESNCDCDRSMESSLLQTVYLQNDTSVLAAIEGARDSWIEQLSKTSKKLTDGSEVKAEEASKELARMKVRLDRAKKADDEKQVERIEERIAELKKLLPAKEGDKSDAAPLVLKPEEVVRQVYLRTVSRPPTDEEMKRCLQFIADSPSQIEGVKGLLWTLVNTKEFIVNR
ncbi:protein of unknown function DUF1549 [Pirellula staleyi DSM 6068]|uniref:BIG2 domain-containing protein n=1 Tax=Pirellula staleyi (strain ATCC 27377 / DSM 6068 / ICPB 4128) TaxID=530564 RepID=D2R4W9_PIRSD|nr:DUF1549 and DUF1553 domain-containing protein [Pirellula staleyi]ADB18931.1 protein of unknown function DUF1549 [Pirellula staleyi DSM 6068]